MVKMPGSFSDVYDQPTGQMSEAPRPVTTNSHPNEALQSDIVEPQQKAPEVPTECEIAILNYSWKVSRKDLLEKSGFFRALFEGSFKEAKTQKVTLHEDSPLMVARMVEWFYYGKFQLWFWGDYDRPLNERGQLTPEQLLLQGRAGNKLTRFMFSIYDKFALPPDEPPPVHIDSRTSTCGHMLVLANKYEIPALEIAILQRMFDDGVGGSRQHVALRLVDLLETPGINKSFIIEKIAPALTGELSFGEWASELEELHEKYPSLIRQTIKSALDQGVITKRRRIDSTSGLPASDLSFLEMMAELGLKKQPSHRYIV